MFDISAVITAHREGIMAGVTLRSFLDAIQAAEKAGINVQPLVVLDCPNGATRDVFQRASELGWRVEEVDFGDQGKARNAALEWTTGKYVSFLDADDLWSENWLVAAFGLCSSGDQKVIAHPEYDLFFQQSNNIFIHADQTDTDFRPSLLRFANYWDALCMAPRVAHADYPYRDRDVEGGFAYEDWGWNCETFAAGYVHRVVKGTIHFKRRRANSQTAIAVRNKVLVPPTDLFDFEKLEKSDSVIAPPSMVTGQSRV